MSQKGSVLLASATYCLRCRPPWSAEVIRGPLFAPPLVDVLIITHWAGVCGICGRPRLLGCGVSFLPVVSLLPGRKSQQQNYKPAPEGTQEDAQSLITFCAHGAYSGDRYVCRRARSDAALLAHGSQFFLMLSAYDPWLPHDTLPRC